MNLDPKNLADDEPVMVAAEAPVAPGVPITDEFVARVNAMTPGEISPANIRTVLAAVNHATSGDPVGTVRLDADGKLAQRINLNGVDQWKITTAAGDTWYDLESTLAWPKIAGPE